jgi:hypothetical protein
MNNSYVQTKRVPLKNCAVTASVYSSKSVSWLVTQVLLVATQYHMPCYPSLLWWHSDPISLFLCITSATVHLQVALVRITARPSRRSTAADCFTLCVLLVYNRILVLDHLTYCGFLIRLGDLTQTFLKIQLHTHSNIGKGEKKAVKC